MKNSARATRGGKGSVRRCGAVRVARLNEDGRERGRSEHEISVALCVASSKPPRVFGSSTVFHSTPTLTHTLLNSLNSLNSLSTLSILSNLSRPVVSTVYPPRSTQLPEGRACSFITGKASTHTLWTRCFRYAAGLHFKHTLFPVLFVCVYKATNVGEVSVPPIRWSFSTCAL